jgi:hypothetical protein
VILLSLLGVLVFFGMTLVLVSGLRRPPAARDRRAAGHVLRLAGATLAVGVVALYGLASSLYSVSANRSRVCDHAGNYDLLPVSSSDLPLSTKCPRGAMVVEVVPGWINPALLIMTIGAIICAVAAVIVRRVLVNGQHGN